MVLWAHLKWCHKTLIFFPGHRNFCKLQQYYPWFLEWELRQIYPAQLGIAVCHISDASQMYTNTHRHRVNCIESSSALILIYTIMLEQLQHQLEVPFKPLLPQRAAKSALAMPAVKRKQGCLICQLILQNIFCFVIHSLIILTKKLTMFY